MEDDFLAGRLRAQTRFVLWRLWWQWVRAAGAPGLAPSDAKRAELRAAAHECAYRVVSTGLAPALPQGAPRAPGTYLASLYEVAWMFLRNHAALLTVQGAPAAQVLAQVVAAQETLTDEAGRAAVRDMASISLALQTQYQSAQAAPEAGAVPAALVENTERLYFAGKLLVACKLAAAADAPALWTDTVAQGRPLSANLAHALCATAERLYGNLRDAAVSGIAGVQPAMATSATPLLEQGTLMVRDAPAPDVDPELESAITSAVALARAKLRSAKKGVSAQVSPRRASDAPVVLAETVFKRHKRDASANVAPSAMPGMGADAAGARPLRTSGGGGSGAASAGVAVLPAAPARPRFPSRMKRRSRSYSDLRRAMSLSDDEQDDADSSTSSSPPAADPRAPVALRSRLDAVAYCRALVARAVQRFTDTSVTLQREGVEPLLREIPAEQTITSERAVLHAWIAELCARCAAPPDLTDFDTLDALTRAADRMIDEGPRALQSDAEGTCAIKLPGSPRAPTHAEFCAARDMAMLRALIKHLADMEHESTTRTVRDFDLTSETRRWQETLRALGAALQALFVKLASAFFDEDAAVAFPREARVSSAPAPPRFVPVRPRTDSKAAVKLATSRSASLIEATLDE